MRIIIMVTKIKFESLTENGGGGLPDRYPLEQKLRNKRVILLTWQ